MFFLVLYNTCLDRCITWGWATRVLFDVNANTTTPVTPTDDCASGTSKKVLILQTGIPAIIAFSVWLTSATRESVRINADGRRRAHSIGRAGLHRGHVGLETVAAATRTPPPRPSSQNGSAVRIRPPGLTGAASLRTVRPSFFLLAQNQTNQRYACLV